MWQTSYEVFSPGTAVPFNWQWAWTALTLQPVEVEIGLRLSLGRSLILVKEQVSAFKLNIDAQALTVENNDDVNKWTITQPAKFSL